MSTRQLLSVILLLTAWHAHLGAETLVLVHGYLGDRTSWQSGEIEQTLQSTGWQRAGAWVTQGQLVHWVDRHQTTGERRYYVTELPSKAPLMNQAQALTVILREIEKRHPDDPLTLIGHSAGGVVSRLALITGGQGQVQRLITIAAPHLGTARAWQAIDATDDSGVFGRLKKWWVKRKVGDQVYAQVKQSRGALADLGPPVPGSLLFWLNGQRHPKIEYVSIIRSAGYGFAGDQLVPAYSQDMNQIPDLRGRSRAIPVAWGHVLQSADANLLVQLLQPKKKPTKTSAGQRQDDVKP